MPIHIVGNLVINNTVVDLSNTTPEQVIHDRNSLANNDPRSSLDLEANVAWSVPESMPEMMPLSQSNINKHKVLEHLKMAREGSGPHYKSYMGDMVTPTIHFKKEYKLKGLEKLHKKSSYVSQFLKE